jgi:hypothetical protein
MTTSRTVTEQMDVTQAIAGAARVKYDPAVKVALLSQALAYRQARLTAVLLRRSHRAVSRRELNALAQFAQFAPTLYNPTDAPPSQ